MKNTIKNKIVNSPSYNEVYINGNSTSQYLVINSVRNINRSNLKEIYSLPDESFNLGDLIEWGNSYWLVTEIDSDNTIQSIGKMTQSNYTLSFQDNDGTIQSVPIIFESKTSSLNENDVLTYVDSGAVVKMQYNPDYNDVLVTNKRLMIDNRLPNVSKPNVFEVVSVDAHSYDNENGIITLTLDRDEYHANKDDKYNMVCDYFTVTESTGTAIISGSSEIKIGGSSRSYVAKFVDSQGDPIDLFPVWSVTAPTEFESYVTSTIVPETNTIKVKVLDCDGLVGKKITLSMTEDAGEDTPTYSASLLITIVPLY